jgi:hypothetical protein
MIMTKLPRKGFSLVVLMGWLVLSVVFAGGFVIEALDHDCTGEQCSVCLQVEIAHRLIEAFGRMGVIVLLAGFVAAYAKPLIKFPAFSRLVLETPVSLKIKFIC